MRVEKWRELEIHKEKGTRKNVSEMDIHRERGIEFSTKKLTKIMTEGTYNKKEITFETFEKR